MILNHSDLMALKNDETAAVAAHPRRATAVPLALEPERTGQSGHWQRT